MHQSPLVSMQGKHDGVYYRLPSGVLIDDLVMWNRLKLEPIADELSARVRATVAPDLEDVQIVRWEHVREELANVVRIRTRSRHGVLGLSQEDLGFRYGGFSPVAPGRWVFLITGSILTGRTAETLLRVLRRMEAEPLAVATVIDGRVNHGAPLSSFAGSVPVISCVQRTLVVDAATAAGGHIVDVDPAGRRVVSPSVHPPEIPDQDLLAWLQRHEDSGIYIGHIERRRAGSGAYYRRARHFSTYLDMGRLIAQDREPVNAVASNVLKNLSAEHLRSRPLRVIYPATEGHIAGHLADAVTAQLRSDLGINISLVAAKRGASGEWRIDDGPWRACSAVIIDWGAVTTATIRALMALAIRHGAVCVHAAVLTSQMSEEAERDLTAMASLRGERGVEEAGWSPVSRATRAVSETVEIPVSASFLARAPMGIATISDCHLCHLAHEFRRHAVHAPAGLLREHARRKVELYRPRSRDEVTSQPPRDLVGNHLDPAEAAKVWECHQLLEQSHSLRGARADIRRAILALPQQDHLTLHAWLRLLTVETSWLNRAPLNGSDARSAIADACLAVLLSGAGEHSSGIRWQAAIVLRVASKAAFVANFAHVLVASQDDTDVSAELCQGMLTLLEKPYNQGRGILKAVLDALHEARQRLATSASHVRPSDEVRVTLNVIYRKATELREGLGIGRIDALASWHALQRSYAEPLRTHDGVVTSMQVVVNAFSGPGASKCAQQANPAEQRSSAYWGSVREAWDRCWDFLAQSVFPHLPALHDQLEPLTWGGVTTLLELDSERAARLSDSLRTLERHPSWFSPGLRAELENEALRWFNALLRAPERRPAAPNDSAFAGSLLLRVLNETPCDLALAWNTAMGRGREAGLRLGNTSGQVPAGVRVFCPRALLIDAIGQILENAIQTHAASGRPSTGADIDVSVQELRDIVQLRIKNNWSTPRSSHEGGLGRFRQELGMFGGSLAHVPLASGADVALGAWTFEVRIQLARWKELR